MPVTALRRATLILRFPRVAVNETAFEFDASLPESGGIVLSIRAIEALKPATAAGGV